MKRIIFSLLITAATLAACREQPKISSINPVNWNKRTVKVIKQLPVKGTTYLSVYSQIYSETEHRSHNLTATVSMRNTSCTDTIYICSADYYNTKGELIRKYFESTIYLKPMETVEIVIDQSDREGGTGANFIFNWQTKEKCSQPLFECIMISTYGQQGLSFTTTGVRVN